MWGRSQPPRWPPMILTSWYSYLVGIHTVHNPRPHWTWNCVNDGGDFLGWPWKTLQLLPYTLLTTYLGNTKCHVMRIHQQPYWESTWEETEVPSQQAVPRCQACVCVSLEEDPAFLIKPSDDAAPADVLTATSWKTLDQILDLQRLCKIINAWCCFRMVNVRVICYLAINDLGSFYFSRSLLQKEEDNNG